MQLVSPVVHDDSYFPANYNDGMGRYVEVLDMQKQAYKEQEYWLTVYERAQQFGIRGFTVQEILLQLQKISQRLQNLNTILLPSAQKKLQGDGEDFRNAANDIKE